MVQELFFEIVREKQHIFCDVKENQQVSELKKIVEGILKIPVADQVLMKPVDETLKEWATLDDKKTFADCGFSQSNAKAQQPATVALLLRGEVEPKIDELSQPPPIPESMRHEQPQEQ